MLLYYVIKLLNYVRVYN